MPYLSSFSMIRLFNLYLPHAQDSCMVLHLVLFVRKQHINQGKGVEKIHSPHLYDSKKFSFDMSFHLHSQNSLLYRISYKNHQPDVLYDCPIFIRCQRTKISFDTVWINNTQLNMVLFHYSRIFIYRLSF